MKTSVIGECSRLPPFHPGGCHRAPVDTPERHRHVSANFVETLAPEQLARARYVLDVREPIVVVSSVLDEGSAGDAQPRVGGELTDEKIEVVGAEGNVRVDIANDIERNVFDRIEAGIEALDLGGKAAFVPLRHPDQHNPPALLCRSRHQLIGPVGGSVADDDPSQGRTRLRKHRPSETADMLLFIARRRHNHVARQPRVARGIDRFVHATGAGPALGWRACANSRL